MSEFEKHVSSEEDKLKEAVSWLLENTWIIRKDEPTAYQLIRERERALRSFLQEKLGLQLLIHPAFIKLEKIPYKPETWMGIQSFQRSRDYAMFAVLLAFLEGKMVEQQFLLSELCDEIESMWPGEEAPNWTLYEERRGLVRVVQHAISSGILHVVDGDTGAFSTNQDEDVLYEGTLIARYLLRAYPEDLYAIEGISDLLKIDESSGLRSTTEIRRHRVYRMLLFSPVMLRQENEEDFLYVRNYRNTIKADIEKMTEFQFELYENAAFVTAPERWARYTLFPDKKVVSDLVVQWATMLREAINEERFVPNHFGSVRLSLSDGEDLLKMAKERFGSGWSKYYQTSSIADTMNELNGMMLEWRMAEETEDGFIEVNPAIGRITGYFPKDFQTSESR